MLDPTMSSLIRDFVLLGSIFILVCLIDNKIDNLKKEIDQLQKQIDELREKK